MKLVGRRVSVIRAEGTPIADGITASDPNPQHIGKHGTIIAMRNTGLGVRTPEIRLDDGTTIYGTECWWSPINPPNNPKDKCP